MYEVKISRNITQYTTVNVEFGDAKNRAEAEALVLCEANLVDWNSHQENSLDVVSVTKVHE